VRASARPPVAIPSRAVRGEGRGLVMRELFPSWIRVD